jgi:hypothetical protein
MDKFFAELDHQEPTLFSGQQRKSRLRNRKPKGCLVLCIVWLYFLGMIGALAAHLFFK